MEALLMVTVVTIVAIVALTFVTVVAVKENRTEIAKQAISGVTEIVRSTLGMKPVEQKSPSKKPGKPTAEPPPEIEGTCRKYSLDTSNTKQITEDTIVYLGSSNAVVGEDAQKVAAQASSSASP